MIADTAAPPMVDSITFQVIEFLFQIYVHLPVILKSEASCVIVLLNSDHQHRLLSWKDGIDLFLGWASWKDGIDWFLEWAKHFQYYGNPFISLVSLFINHWHIIKPKLLSFFLGYLPRHMSRGYLNRNKWSRSILAGW